MTATYDSNRRRLDGYPIDAHSQINPGPRLLTTTTNGLVESLNQRVRGSSPWRRTNTSPQRPGRPAIKITDTFRTLSPHRPPDPAIFKDVSNLRVRQLAPEITIMRRVDLGVTQLVADLSGGHVGVIEEAGDGLAEHVADQSLIWASSRTCRHTCRTLDDPASRRASQETACTAEAMARRRRLSIVTAQLGRGITRSPPCLIWWTAAAAARRPCGGPSASARRQWRVQDRSHLSRWRGTLRCGIRRPQVIQHILHRPQGRDPARLTHRDSLSGGVIGSCRTAVRYR